MAMEEPISGVVGFDADHDVAVVGHSDSVFERWTLEVTLDETFSVEFEHVFEVNFFDGFVRGSADADDVKCVTWN